MTPTTPHQQPLIRLVERWTQHNPHFATPINGLTLHRRDAPTPANSSVLAPHLCLIAQGRKQVILGNETYTYDANHFLFTAIDLPVITRVLDAAPDKPYLGILLRLDPLVLAQLMLTMRVPMALSEHEQKGLAVGELTADINNAFIRLLHLLDTPADIPVLSPLIIQEIFYRLLISPQGSRLKRIAAAGTAGHRITTAIDWLRNHIATPFRVDDLAARIGMSTSAFHQHFRAITAMSPLQYQKRLRLTEARRLLLTEHRDITTAAAAVGYESPSQFSREYKRFFGNLPSADRQNH